MSGDSTAGGTALSPTLPVGGGGRNIETGGGRRAAPACEGGQWRITVPVREGGTTAALEGSVCPQTLHSILNTSKCTLDNLKCILYLHQCLHYTSKFTLQKALNLRLDRVIPLKYGKLILGLDYLLRN